MGKGLQALVSEKREAVIAMRKSEQETYLLCKSEGRAKKEEAIWWRAKEKMESELRKLQKRITRGRLKDAEKIHRAIGRLKERHPRIARFYEIRLTGSSEREWDLLWRLDSAREAEREILNGTLLRTNRDDLVSERIWQIYTMLTKVERAFRCLKSELGLRPNYHQKDPRIKGHIFISLLVYHLLHTIEWTLRRHGHYKSWERLKEILTTHQLVTVTLPDEEGKVHHLRLMTEPDVEQKKIYRRLRLNERPLRYKHLVVG